MRPARAGKQTNIHQEGGVMQADFINAIKEPNLPRVQRLFNKTGDCVDATDESGDTPLLLALDGCKDS